MSSSPQTRASLILRLRDHDDAEAWNEFVAIYEPLVFGVMMRAGLQTADAAEQTQEVMAAVAGAINRWEPDQQRGRFRTWLHRVSRNILADFWKQQARKPVTGNFEGSLNDVPAEPLSDAQFEAEFQRQAFVAAANHVKSQIEEKTWLAFWKSAVEQEPIAKVGECLDMKPGSIYVARSRVMKKLQEAVRYFLPTNEVV